MLNTFDEDGEINLSEDYDAEADEDVSDEDVADEENIEEDAETAEESVKD